MVNLDSHVLLSIVGDRLRPRERDVLESDSWAISDIVLWEIAVLERDRRILPVLDSRAFTTVLNRLTVYPLDWLLAKTLTRLDFRSDPADEIIAATSIRWDVPLLTRDMRILSSKVVPLALR